MNAVTWRRQNGPVSPEEIEHIQGQLGIKFPEDYLECAQQNNGGRPSKEGVPIAERGSAVFLALLSFHRESKINIVDFFDAVQDRLVSGVIPFADDPFGNFFCFDYRRSDTDPSIVFWDHEIAFTDPEAALFPVCSSFTELLEMLYDIRTQTAIK